MVATAEEAEDEDELLFEPPELLLLAWETCELFFLVLLIARGCVREQTWQGVNATCQEVCALRGTSFERMMGVRSL